MLAGHHRAAAPSKKFVFPGIMAMSVVMTPMFSGISIVWDRELGCLREPGKLVWDGDQSGATRLARAQAG